MQSQAAFTEITFYYINGETESFDIPVSSETFAQQLPDLLSQPYITLHLFDQTVIVFTAQIIKVELKPPIPEFQGQGVFSESQRVTALTRGAKV
ncbi:MAG TPA: hypothetical protein DCY91_00260 [Cyanobacteria bacterium UBA11370]|nr:hypothetical protein [Cyanobacteria bacterium UBA11370]